MVMFVLGGITAIVAAILAGFAFYVIALDAVWPKPDDQHDGMFVAILTIVAFIAVVGALLWLLP